MKKIRRILFVCTGNSCRSIMAEAYARKRLREQGFSIEVRSAGTFGINGFPPTRETIAILNEYKIDTAGLKSSALTKELIQWADIVLAMTQEHKTKVLDMVPEAEGKVVLWNNIAIPDPIGQTPDFYKETFNRIKQLIEELTIWLEK